MHTPRAYKISMDIYAHVHTHTHHTHMHTYVHRYIYAQKHTQNTLLACTHALFTYLVEDCTPTQRHLQLVLAQASKPTLQYNTTANTRPCVMQSIYPAGAQQLMPSFRWCYAA